ncbi:MAG: phosphate ABC transporter substrate-binding protein [Anaerolineae bacterium]|nr:phosphate ABC transporter substrate-binding protein [Anaerolineae bacterium]MDH7473113.1 phosphate ABC transporter substrate-binding protein [Anaerolineae bacterium]
MKSLCWLLVALLITGCGTTVTLPAPATLRLAGSTSMQPLLADLSAAYRVRASHVTIIIEGGGSRLGRELAAEGGADLGLTSWLPAESEVGWSVPIALDGIAVIVHPNNPLDGLTLLQLRHVFSGRFWRWEDVGGNYGEITVVSREDGSGTRAVFEERVMEGQAVTSTAVVMPSSQAVIEYVAGHPLAIGYVSMGCLSPGVKALAVEGIAPTPTHVKDGSYHLTRPLYLVAAHEPQGEIRAFVDFCLSPAGQAIVGKRYGAVK